MKDQLEDFVNQNRNAFDDKEVPEKAWSGIESSISGKNNWWNSAAMWRAAAIFFMVISAYLLIPKYLTTRQPRADLSSREFNDIEAFYIDQISQKVEMIDGFQQKEDLNGFAQDFKQLEAMYMVLKEEIKSHPSQKVKDALVLNLLIRIDLLNQQLHMLEQDSKSVGEKKNQSATI